MWKDRPVGYGTIALLVAAWSLIVYGTLWVVMLALFVLAIGPAALVPNVYLFGVAYLLYVALGISLHFGIRSMYFLAFIVTGLMIVWHIGTIVNRIDPLPSGLVAPFIAANLFIICFLVAGYTGLESRAKKIDFGRLVRKRIRGERPVCPNCGSQSVQVLGADRGRCSLCGKVLSL